MVQPRVLRPVSDPLGGYLRPGQDHKVLLQMLVEGRSIGTGLVADPCHSGRHQELMDEARRRGVETVLDPRTLELSTEGGFLRGGVRDLPWAGQRPHLPQDLAGPRGALVVRRLVSFLEDSGHSAVLAPTHYLEDGGDSWLAVDAELTRQLRRMLDSRGMRDVLIYYPLMLKASVLRHPEHRQSVTDHLAGLPIDGIWLRAHPFGTANSGPLVLSRYLELCRALHVLKIPLVAERSGTIGVALLAFGAVGGIESGVTQGEAVNLEPYFSLPKPGTTPFSRPPRVYLHHIGAFLDAKNSEAFFSVRGMRSAHGCQHSCCPRGWTDMQLDPRRHFIAHRAREVTAISAVPDSLRAGHYMENFLRPASDRAVRAAAADPTLTTPRLRLDSWRGTLGADLETHSSFTISPPAAGKRLRRTA